MYRVVLTDFLKPVAPEEAVLKEIDATLTYGTAATEDDVIELAGEADAIISVYAPVTARVINGLKKCRVIVRRGIGYDTVDIAAATARGIPVANVPEYCTDEVADHTLTLLLSAVRRVTQAKAQTGAGDWDLKRLLPIPPLKDAWLGLVGFGKIPKAVAARARCFGLKVQTSDPFISEELAAEHYVKLISLDDLLRTSDFISVHVPLSQATRGMISKREFSLMKPSVVLVNTARGPLVDEAALIEALRNGKIAAAALDVTDPEPPAPDNPLRQMANVIITPHIAWYSERSARLLGEKAAQEVVRVLKGYLPKALLNPEVAKLRPELKPSD